jgi:1-acyl-sn-glycerol-3-phosphate acyltransferase
LKELLLAWVVFKLSFPKGRSFSMRHLRRTTASAPARAKAPTQPLASGYALVVDGQMKTAFETKDRALKAAMELKNRFPKLQVKVFNAEEQQLEELELTAA